MSGPIHGLKTDRAEVEIERDSKIIWLRLKNGRPAAALSPQDARVLAAALKGEADQMSAEGAKARPVKVSGGVRPVAEAAAEDLISTLRGRGNAIYPADAGIVASAFEGYAQQIANLNALLDDRDQDVRSLRAEIVGQGRALEEAEQKVEALRKMQAAVRSALAESGTREEMENRINCALDGM